MRRILVRCCLSSSVLVIFSFIQICFIDVAQSYVKPIPISFSNVTIGNNITELDSFNASYREARRSVVSGGIFSLVSFENVPCNTTSGSGDVGICYSNRECINLGGTPSGPCAGGYGVCCAVTVTCDGTMTINNTYLVNPSYPSTDTGPLSCTITINKLPGASQLYLEFTNFQIMGPTKGSCTSDSFTIVVTGTSTPVSYPVLCGVNTGQMEYIDLSQATGPVKITFRLSATSFPRFWKIRAVEFKPNDLCAAPAGCFQYFRDLSGTIESFNYNMGQGQFLNNYCYKICFAPHPGYCNLLLTENNFMLSGTATARDDCIGEYIEINGEQFCGDSLNNGMVQLNQTTPGSSLFLIVCSGDSNPDEDVGFSLNYNFLPCMAGMQG